MAFIGLRVPHETARLLSEIEVVSKFGDPEPPGNFHITMAYLGKEVSVQKIAEAIPVIHGVVAETRPFTVATSRVTTFPTNPDDGVPIIAAIDSNELHIFRGKLVAALTAAKIEFPNKYPEYKPHVTLGYSPDPLVHMDNVVDLQIPTIEWGAHEVILWGGDNGDTSIVVTFPLSVARKSFAPTALHRAFVQLSLGHA